MKTFKEIKDTMARNITGKMTSENAFKYENDKWVRENIPYSIYYTNDMEEYYVTETVIPRIIIPVKVKTMFAQYVDASSNEVVPTEFATAYKAEPSKKDIRLGYMYRYFARQANNKFAPIIEVKDSTYKKKSSFYIHLRVKWLIVGSHNEVFLHNTNTVFEIRDYFDNPRFILDVLNMWQRVPTKKEETLQKIARF